MALRTSLYKARRTLAAVPLALAASRELVVHCRHFFNFLNSHHRSEDHSVFPLLENSHPELVPVVKKLMQDHVMIENLVLELETAIEAGARSDGLEQHLDGIEAVMETHFASEERQLVAILNATTGLGTDAGDTWPADENLTKLAVAYRIGPLSGQLPRNRWSIDGSNGTSRDSCQGSFVAPETWSSTTLSLGADRLGGFERLFGNNLIVVATLCQCHRVVAVLRVGQIDKFARILEIQGIDDVAQIGNILGPFGCDLHSGKCWQVCQLNGGRRATRSGHPCRLFRATCSTVAALA